MPLFPNASTYYKGRTHTQLVISEGNAPAEKYIPSAATNAKVQFNYEFGPQGNQEVVIPKGKAVAISGMEWDYETEHMVPALKIADGTVLNEGIIGVNHHNVYKRTRDRFGGNQPTVITREYIELPLFGDKDQAAAIKFGAAWVADPNAMLGKYVAVDENGNFTLANDTYKNVIGQCLGIETDVPPAGYLQYFLEMEDADFAKFMRDMSYAPSPGKNPDSAWNDIGMYPEGTGYLRSKEDLLKNFRSGIPFLTDGYFKARTAKTYTLASEGVSAKVTGEVTVAVDGTLETVDGVDPDDVARDLRGASVFIKLPEKLVKDNLQTSLSKTNFPEYANGPEPSNVAAYFGEASAENLISPDRVHVDYTNNQVVVYLEGLDADVANGATITITCVVLENQVPGIPTGWDFKGSLGAARILLQK